MGAGQLTGLIFALASLLFLGKMFFEIAPDLTDTQMAIVASVVTGLVGTVSIIAGFMAGKEAGKKEKEK